MAIMIDKVKMEKYDLERLLVEVGLDDENIGNLIGRKEGGIPVKLDVIMEHIDDLDVMSILELHKLLEEITFMPLMLRRSFIGTVRSYRNGRWREFMIRRFRSLGALCCFNIPMHKADCGKKCFGNIELARVLLSDLYCCYLLRYDTQAVEECIKDTEKHDVDGFNIMNLYDMFILEDGKRVLDMDKFNDVVEFIYVDGFYLKEAEFDNMEAFRKDVKEESRNYLGRMGFIGLD